MKKKILPMISGLMLLCLAVVNAVNATAGLDEESKKWMSRLADLYKKAPYSFEMVADMNINQMGMQVAMKMNGTMYFLDQTHYRMNMDMDMEMPQQGKMDMKMSMIGDGKFIWMEMKNPMMGEMKQVMKMSLDKLESMAQAGGMGSLGLNDPNMLDPSKIIENMGKIMDIEFKGLKDGKAILEANLTEEFQKTFATGQAGGNTEPGLGKFIMTLDEKNLFPMEMTIQMGEMAPAMSFKFQNLKFPKKEELGEDFFSYTPPEGVQVMDLDAMGAGPQKQQ